MRIKSIMGILTTIILLMSPSLGWAQDAISAPGSKTIGSGGKPEVIPSLAVLNSHGAKLDGGKLTLSGVSPNSIVFADRPFRAAGHVLTSEFIKQWDEGADSFAKDPPNATISVFSKDGSTIEDAVVELRAPKLENADLTFDVTVLEGRLTSADGPASLFIDWFVVGGGRWHRPHWHGGWYGYPGGYGAGFAAGAALGAATAPRPYYPYYPPPPCGYYPYPPCY